MTYYDICYFLSNKASIKKVLIETIKEFPYFFNHLFGWFDCRRTKWTFIHTDVSRMTKHKLMIYPNALFTKLETMQYILTFLSSDIRMLNLFIFLLIEEKERIYWVDLLPSLIFLSIVSHSDESNNSKIHSRIMQIYKQNSSLWDTIVASEVNAKIRACIDQCIKHTNNIKSLVAQNLIDNVEFQSKHTSWNKFSFTTEMCICKTNILRWSQVVNVQFDGTDNEIVLLYVDGIVGRSTFIKMKSPNECESARVILSVQLDLMQAYHCEHYKQYSSNSCLKEHWDIVRQLNVNSSMNFAMLSLSDYRLPPNIESIGDNCYINIVNLKVETVDITHVCIKQLLNFDKAKNFWKMICIYSEWFHPNILKFYGFVDGEFALFREYADGPLIAYLVTGTNDTPFTFKNLLQVLSEIGGVLYYLHDNLKQYHGNVNLQRIMKVRNSYKISEPSLDRRVEKNYLCLSDFGDNLDLKNASEQTHDVWQLIYSVIAIFYVDKAMAGKPISRDTFLTSLCNDKLRDLIVKWLSKDCRMETILRDIYTATFSHEEMDLVIVKPNNQHVPEFLKIVARDANMFEVIKIEFKNLSKLEQIGSGHFSTVFKAQYRDPKNQVTNVAVKMLKDTNLKSITLLRELRPSTIVSHHNVLKSIGFSQNEDHMYIITELGITSLLVHLQTEQLSNATCLDFCMQICDGMQFMSDENKIIHRDLAARNVIVFLKNRNYVLKISDFGLTLLLRDSNDYYNCEDQASILWLPPQDIDNKQYSLKTDIFSFGVVMWEIFSRGKDVKKCNRDVNKYKPELNKPDNIVDGAYEIIESCRAYDSKDRPANFESINKLLKELN